MRTFLDTIPLAKAKQLSQGKPPPRIGLLDGMSEALKETVAA
jgi:hypothetical protein